MHCVRLVCWSITQQSCVLEHPHVDAWTRLRRMHPSLRRPSAVHPPVSLSQVEKALNAIGAARIAGMVSLASSSNRCPLLWPLVGAKAAAGAGLACGGVRASLASAPPDELNLPPISAESFFAEELGAFGLQAQLGPGDVANPAAIYSACLRPPPPAASDSMDSDGIDGMGISVSLDTVVAAPLEDFELLVRSAGAGTPSLPSSPPHDPDPAPTSTSTPPHLSPHTPVPAGLLSRRWRGGRAWRGAMRKARRERRARCDGRQHGLNL